MQTTRICTASGVVDGKIYAIGGGRDATGGYLATVEEYNPATDTWIQKADMSTTKMLLSTCVVDGKIYAIGKGAWNKTI
jgi:hypothetical protein